MSFIHHRITGNASSSICLVFIHGLLCDHNNWAHQIDYFQNKFQVLTLDLPGHGQTVAQPKQDWDMINLALKLKEWLVDLNLNKQLVLIAHSASVRIALEVNVVLTHQVAGLVLIDCGYQSLHRPDPNRWLMELRQRGYVNWLKHFFTSKFGLRTATLQQIMLQKALSLNPEMGEALYIAVKNYDYYALKKCLSLTKVPVLVLQSTFYKNGQLQTAAEAIPADSEWLDLIQLTLPKAIVQIIPNCGHWIMLEQPDACNHAIGQFIGLQQAGRTSAKTRKFRTKVNPSNNFELPFDQEDTLVLTK